MRIFNKFNNTQGFISTYNHILKTRNVNKEANGILIEAPIVVHLKEKFSISYFKYLFNEEVFYERVALAFTALVVTSLH